MNPSKDEGIRYDTFLIVLEGQVTDELRIILTDEFKAFELEMLALKIIPDHHHLLVGAKPTHISYVIVK